MNSENQYDADDERDWDDCPEEMELIESPKEHEESFTISDTETDDKRKDNPSDEACEIIAVIPAPHRSATKPNVRAVPPSRSAETLPPKTKPRRAAARRATPAAAAAARVQRGRVAGLRGDKFGVTPLHIAVERRSLELVRLLVRAGADVDAQDCSGRSPLHIACEMDRMDLVQVLLGMRRRRIRQLYPPKGHAVRPRRRKPESASSESSLSTVA